MPRAESFSIHWQTIVWWSIHPLLQRGESTDGGPYSYRFHATDNRGRLTGSGSPRVWAELLSYPYNQQYDVSPDGRRFLMNTIIDEVPSPITIILNWFLRRTLALAFLDCDNKILKQMFVSVGFGKARFHGPGNEQ